LSDRSNFISFIVNRTPEQDVDRKLGPEVEILSFTQTQKIVSGQEQGSFW